MKIVLADYWSDATIRLSESLQRSKIPYQSVVIHYEGRLPESAWSPFTYYTGWHNRKGPGLHFNDVKVPLFYEIRHFNAFSAHIYSGDFLAGIIHYFSGGERKVRQVDWLNQKGRKIVSDFYAIQGYRFAYQVYNIDEKPVRKWFINEYQEEIIDCDLENQQFLLKQQGKVRCFMNMTDFIIFFLGELLENKKAFSKVDALFINSLSFPLFVANTLQTIPTTLFFQETIQDNCIPRNMCFQLENQTVVQSIIFETMAELETVRLAYGDRTSVKLTYLAPLEQFERKPLYVNKVLILTTSDELYYIEEIMESLPGLSLTIAAPTEISSKLRNLRERYPSVTLHPQANKTDIEKLILSHDIYLDIHAGQEVENSIIRMYKKNYLIIGINKVAKNPRYELLTNDSLELITILKTSMENKKKEDTLRKLLHEKNGPRSTIREYKRYL
ncbi:hypothetical protein LHM76_002784 [Listeria monocytogenes]|nr:hypothetical protein [Listeria monocytogenes]